MTVRRRSIPNGCAIWALLVGAALAAGCYKPSIQDGSLGCGPNNSCPDGFHCVADRCYLPRVDASVSEADGSTLKADGPPDGPAEASPDVVTDAPDGAEVCAPRTAPSGCVPRSDLRCDPVCQTGCCTSQKCSAVYNSGGPSSTTSLDCFGNVGPRGLGERCDVLGAATSSRSDNCSAGLICVEGNVGNYCLKLCRGDGDCDGTKCEPRTLELAKASNVASVCGLAPTACDPTLNAASAGCPANHVCYLVEPGGTSNGATVCEIRSGETARNLSCTRSRDCLAGLTCPATGPGAGICRPVCSRKTTPDGCPAGTTCQEESGADTYNFCF